jgi:uncharacterized protein YdaU (DUF1376 family)
MAPAKFSGPWLPWYHGDFLRATQGWTVTERGVYFLLLGASWEMGPLPDDRRRLAGIVGAQLDEFDEAWKTVRPKFVLTDAGLVNHRLEFHRDKQALRSEKARQSVMNRWQEKLPLDTDEHTNDDTNVPTSAHTSDDTSAHTNGHTKSIRSGYSSELRTQNSEKGKNTKLKASFHDEVIAAYHECLPNQPRVKQWTKTRASLLNARIAERCKDGKPADGIGYWRDFFGKVAASDFLTGKSSDFTVSLEWLVRPQNFLKVIEGNYDNRPRMNGTGRHAP